MKIEIETEFDIGDEVWAIFRKQAIDKYEVVGLAKIESIFFQYNFKDSGPSILYSVNDPIYAFTPDEIFKTREAAEIAAEALNK